MYQEGISTYQAGEDLAVNRRVKIESGTTTDPPEVIYADAGEAFIGITVISASDGYKISVRPANIRGTVEAVAADTFDRGADLYGAVDGKVSDTVSGSIIGIAVEAATAADQTVQIQLV